MDLNVTSIIVSGRNGKINCQNLTKQSSLSQKKKKNQFEAGRKINLDVKYM